MITMHVKDLQILMVGNRSQVSSDGTTGTQVKRGEFGGGMVANRVLWLRSCFLHLALSTVYWLANSCWLPCQRLCNPLPQTLNQSDSLVGRISSSTKTTGCYISNHQQLFSLACRTIITNNRYNFETGYM